MPLDRTIDVTVPHTLPQATAWERVLRWLNDSKATAADPRTSEHGAMKGTITPQQITVDFVAHRIQLTLDAYSKIVKATISVEPNVVELHSEPIQGGMLEMMLIKGSILIGEGRIYSQLVEALKP